MGSQLAGGLIQFQAAVMILPNARISAAAINGVGTAFYEACLLSSGCMQIGWVEASFVPTVTVFAHHID